MKQLSNSWWNLNRIRIYKIIAVVLILCFLPQHVRGEEMWSSSDYYNDKFLEFWNVSEDEIVKVINPGRAYMISDISQYSAYISNMPEDVGNSMENSFRWSNKSRIGYIKLLKVEGGTEVSFLLENNFYVYCAQYSKDFVLIDHGNWGTTGDVFQLLEDTEWIMIVFRKSNGDLSIGADQDSEISSEDIAGGIYEYIIFEPFIYTFNLNGGVYMDNKENFTMERLGVESFEFPKPERKGYSFMGWRCNNGKLYSEKLSNDYDEVIFGDTSFTAVWWPNKAESVIMNRSYVILEQNTGETAQLAVTVMPEDTLDKSVEWSSDNENVATVDEHGVVTAGSTGIATVTARTPNGIEASCKIYVMGFEVSVPSYCNLYDAYEIDVKIYNNGTQNMSDRKRVILDTEGAVELVREGDAGTSCMVVAETSQNYGSDYVTVSEGYVMNTTESKKVYYRLMPTEEIKKAGDYEGNITFTVSVR